MAGALDRGKLVAAVVERLNVRLDQDDPAFVLVELNRLALAETAQAAVKEIGGVAEKIERAGEVMLQDVREAINGEVTNAKTSASREIDREVEEARKTAAKLIAEVAAANRNVNASKWFAVAGSVGLALACVSFGAGYFLASSQAEAAALQSGSVLATPEGQAAVKLAQLGQARMLAQCSAPGWRAADDGYCYGTATAGGKVHGWRVK